jgi:hypothetical protein
MTRIPRECVNREVERAFMRAVDVRAISCHCLVSESGDEFDLEDCEGARGVDRGYGGVRAVD